MSLVISCLIGGIIVALQFRGMLQQFELKIHDMVVRKVHEVNPSSPITVIGISESDIHSWQHYPINDKQMAELLEKLVAMKPRAIGVDIFRDQETDADRPSLNAVLTANPNIVVCEKSDVDPKRAVGPPAVLRGTEQVGYVNLPTDPDGILRRAMLFAKDAEETKTSFAMQLVSIYLDAENIPVGPSQADENVIAIGGVPLHRFARGDGPYVNVDAGGYQMLLDHGGPEPVTRYSAADLFDGRVGEKMIRDRIVLVGVTAESQKDYISTPVSGEQFGIDVHAQIIDQLLRIARGQPAQIRVWHYTYKAIWTLMFALLGGMLGLRIRSPQVFAIGGLVGLSITSTISFMLFQRHIWIPFVAPTLAWFTAAAIVTSYMSYREKNDRTLLMWMFSRLVPEDVASTLWTSRDQLIEDGRLRTQEVTATIMFTDLKGFSNIASKLEPSALMGWLNEYMDEMSEIVKANHGFVARYLGDGIMAGFGVPIPHESRKDQARDAANAIRCGLDMRKKMRVLNDRWSARGATNVGMRVGIFTGKLVVGGLGSADRWEYTFIGDTVNTASRLESFDKTFMPEDVAANACRILMGQSTRDMITETQFVTRCVGEHQLPGLREKIPIHGVVDYGSETAIA